MSNHLDFSLSLHRQLTPPAKENFCWSPYSVASALGLAAAATGGRTRAELFTALRATESNAGLTELLELLGGAADPGNLGAEDAPELAVANTLWADEALPVEESYLQAIRDWPGSALRNTAFRSAPDQARRRINADVAETTRGLIPELLHPGTVDPDTVAALVNALYLKASWTEPFDEHATEPVPFHTPWGRRDVPTMRVTRLLGYASHDGWQVVTLPTAGDVEAVVLLPDGEPGPAESGLDAARLDALVSSAGQRRIELLLPRFEVTGDAELQRPLGALGAHTLFTPAADFSPLTTSPLRVSAMVHQSVLRVDEHGLEGAAATAAVMRLVSAVREEEPIRVEVDRPFLFLVRHRPTGALYFLARVVDPS
ncbi:serpin family protein [Haloactinomyces albus]|uniref:Serpin B n=1 Tax=Haloactinomyces albus TaxID=1352928 RepID=A0AAE4CKM2_9ACTN|nr:serpin family protein [Haloactinomyces albus]MDR7300894.1 serpin B [Haloactinomyces albus]